MTRRAGSRAFPDIAFSARCLIAVIRSPRVSPAAAREEAMRNYARCRMASSMRAPTPSYRRHGLTMPRYYFVLSPPTSARFKMVAANAPASFRPAATILDVDAIIWHRRERYCRYFGDISRSASPRASDVLRFIGLEAPRSSTALEAPPSARTPPEKWLVGANIEAADAHGEFDERRRHHSRPGRSRGMPRRARCPHGQAALISHAAGRMPVAAADEA